MGANAIIQGIRRWCLMSMVSMMMVGNGKILNIFEDKENFLMDWIWGLK